MRYHKGVTELKKISAAIMFALIFALSALPASAAEDWDSFVLRMEQREKIKTAGTAVLDELRKSAPQGTEEELWLATRQGDAQARAAAAVALTDRLFPSGDPARWEEVSGFFTNHRVQPRQLAAIDALFSAVTYLRELPNGVWASAYLLDRFGKSAMGRLKFIDDTPAEFRSVIDSVLAETKLMGDWGSTKIRGRLPLLPVYRGYTTRNRAESLNMQYLDGYGSIASNGRYAWDRDRNYLYEVVETDDRIIFRD